MFYHMKEHQRPSQNRACRFPAHGSSVELTSRTTAYTDGERCEVQEADSASNTLRSLSS